MFAAAPFLGAVCQLSASAVRQQQGVLQTREDGSSENAEASLLQTTPAELLYSGSDTLQKGPILTSLMAAMTPHSH